MPSYTGPLKLDNQTLNEDLTITGPFTANNLTVNELSLTGPMRARTLNCQKMTVTGSCDMQNLTVGNTVKITGPVTAIECKVNGKTTIIGPIHVTKGQFKDMDLTTNKATLERTTADNIVISGDSNFGISINGRQIKDDQPVLILTGTKINGNIEFKNKKGIVHLKNRSQVVGKIINGEIKQEEFVEQPLSIQNRFITIPKPSAALIAVFLIGCILSFSLGGPLGLSIALAVITGLLLVAKASSLVVNQNRSSTPMTPDTKPSIPTSQSPAPEPTTPENKPIPAPGTPATTTETPNAAELPERGKDGPRIL